LAIRQRLRAETRDRTPLSAISVMEQRLFLGERLLRDNDVASMASSLEQRVPLVDQVLFEGVDRLPERARFRPLGRKAMLRRIGLRGLDPALFERPKSGFVLPFDRWIRRGLKDVMDQTLRDPQVIARVGLDPAAVERLWRAFLGGAPGLYWSRVWSVYVFIRWCHRNRVFR
jgi:asparagine synthase (glutamine-hydrolysing)